MIHPLEAAHRMRRRWRLMASYVRRSRRAALVSAAVLTAGLTGTFALRSAAPRQYRSESVLLYRPRVQMGTVGLTEADSHRQVGLRLQETLLARDRLGQLMDELGLYRAELRRGRPEAIEQMQKDTTFTVGEGSTFRLGFRGSSPTQARAVTARLAELLIEENRRFRTEQATATKGFVDEEKRRADAELGQHEAALSTFLAKHPELASETAAGQPVAGASIRALNPARDSAQEAVLLALQLQALQTEQGLLRGDTGLLTLASPARAAAETEVDAARRELTEKQAEFTDQHPDVKAARTRLERALARLSRVQPAVPVAAPPQAPRADEARANVLRERIARVGAEIAAHRFRRGGAARRDPEQLVALDTEWTRLDREATESRERVQQLETRQFQAALLATAHAQGAELEIIDPAYLPARAEPGIRRKILIFGALFSLLLGAAVFGSGALLDDGVYGAADLERLRVARVVVAVPPLQRREASHERG